MKQLENRTLDSKIELEIMDALDEIKAVNRRHETVNTEDVLKAAAARRENTAADQVREPCVGVRVSMVTWYWRFNCHLFHVREVSPCVAHAGLMT